MKNKCAKIRGSPLPTPAAQILLKPTATIHPFHANCNSTYSTLQKLPTYEKKLTTTLTIIRYKLSFKKGNDVGM